MMKPTLDRRLPTCKIKMKTLKRSKVNRLTGKQAVSIAKRYMNFGGKAKVKVTENGNGSDYGFYSVSIRIQKTNEEGSMDITKKAGYPIWFINYREVNEGKISLNDANLKAATFLKG